MRPIDADIVQKTIDVVEEHFEKKPAEQGFRKRCFNCSALRYFIDKFPTLDVESVRRGCWIIKSEVRGCMDDDGWWEEWSGQCSECDRIVYVDGWLCECGDFEKAFEQFNYCPSCGAKMDLEAEENETN